MSKKTSLILFAALLLVLVAGFYLMNLASDKGEGNGIKNEETRSIVYGNSNQKFSLTIPKDWEGKYYAEERERSVAFVYSLVPELRTPIFTVYMHTQEEWKVLEEEPYYHGTLIAPRNGQIFVYTIPLENPYEPYGMETADEFQAMVGDVQDIISTFNFGITVKGTVVCLPHRKTSGPITLECAIGLEDEQGNYYGLSDPSPDYERIISIPMNVSVLVTGFIDPTPSEKYRTIGTMEIWDIETIN